MLVIKIFFIHPSVRGKGGHHIIVNELGSIWHIAHAHEVLSMGARARVAQDTLVHGLGLLHTERRVHHAHAHLHGEHMRR